MTRFAFVRLLLFLMAFGVVHGQIVTNVTLDSNKTASVLVDSKNLSVEYVNVGVASDYPEPKNFSVTVDDCKFYVVAHARKGNVSFDYAVNPIVANVTKANARIKNPVGFVATPKKITAIGSNGPKEFACKGLAFSKSKDGLFAINVTLTDSPRAGFQLRLINATERTLPTSEILTSDTDSSLFNKKWFIPIISVSLAFFIIFVGMIAFVIWHCVSRRRALADIESQPLIGDPEVERPYKGMGSNSDVEARKNKARIDGTNKDGDYNELNGESIIPTELASKQRRSD